jgi:K+-sensing histidine kinase KdpD
MVLVCVTAQDACDRLIVAGSRLAALEQLELKVIPFARGMKLRGSAMRAQNICLR